MKTALILFGNLRTFLMPTRENPSKRLCDLLMENIIIPNDADVFAFTDTNDFFFNGVQYYSTDKKIEVLNNDSCRLHSKIDFISNERATGMITDQLKLIIGSHLKSFHIEDIFDARLDPKFSLLNNANVGGSSPFLLIHQFRKLKLAYELVKKYEQENNLVYDIIIKWRFDLNVSGQLNISAFDFDANDVFVAGIYPPIVYDWHAFGNRKGMEYCLNIYDILGSFLNEGKVHLQDQSRTEITLSPEYHLFRSLKDSSIRYTSSGYPGAPYRYQGTSTSNIDPIIRALGIDATVVTFTPTNKVYEQEYKK
jgi:hypothetical protein